MTCLLGHLKRYLGALEIQKPAFYTSSLLFRYLTVNVRNLITTCGDPVCLWPLFIIHDLWSEFHVAWLKAALFPKTTSFCLISKMTTEIALFFQPPIPSSNPWSGLKAIFGLYLLLAFRFKKPNFLETISILSDKITCNYWIKIFVI